MNNIQDISANGGGDRLRIRKFDGPVTVTSDDLESNIFQNDSSTSTNTIYWLVATLILIVDERTYGTYGRAYVRMDGHLFTNSMSHIC